MSSLWAMKTYHDRWIWHEMNALGAKLPKCSQVCAFWSFPAKGKTPNESTKTCWAHLHRWCTRTHLPANEWVMVRWHTWRQTVRGSEKWMGWRVWRMGCKSAGATGRLTSSWSCSPSLCLHPEACRCKKNLDLQVLWHSHLEAFAWKYRRIHLDAAEMNTMTGNSHLHIFSLKAFYSPFMICATFCFLLLWWLLCIFYDVISCSVIALSLCSTQHISRQKSPHLHFSVFLF